MLRELSDIRQEGRRRRRWFQSGDEDLIVWHAEDGTIHGFQFCYDRGGNERALTWMRRRGFSHDRVDDGEGRPFRHKGSPVLVADGPFDVPAMLRRFQDISTRLPQEIADFVSAKLAEYRLDSA